MASRNNQQLNLMDILSQFGLLGMTDENETKLQGTFSSRPTSLRNQNQINIDIINEENLITIFAEVPGVKLDDLNIEIDNNKLTIQCEKKCSNSRQSNRNNTNEIKYGRMTRTITLPFCITEEKTICTTLSHGILKIVVNKLIEDKNKFIVKPTEVQDE